MKEKCGYCTPDKDGDYTMYVYQHPSDPDRTATISVYGGSISVSIDQPGDEKTNHLTFPIKYCPMCGKAYNNEQ